MERVPWHKALFDRALARVQKSHVLFSQSRPRSFWEGLLAQLSTDNVRVRAEIVASTSTPSTRRLHGRVVAAT